MPLSVSVPSNFVKKTVQIIYLTFKEEEEFVLQSGLYLQESFLLAISILSAFVEKHHCHGTALFMVRLFSTFFNFFQLFSTFFNIYVFAFPTTKTATNLRKSKSTTNHFKISFFKITRVAFAPLLFRPDLNLKCNLKTNNLLRILKFLNVSNIPREGLNKNVQYENFPN